MTTTVWLQLAELLLQSVAVQVRVTVLVPGQLPAVTTSLEVTTGLGSQVSLTDGAGKTGAFGHWIGDTATGQVIVGGVVSMTTTVWLQVAELLLQSVAVQVRVTVLVPGQLPAVTTSLEVTTGLGSQVSLTVGAGKTGAFGH